jgi:general secretion pathway protein A
MYTEFYGLKEKPFNLTPSPRFLYLGETHKEALAFLTYGVVERSGFILLTGEVGTGKTTMVRALLENLISDVKYVHLSNPLLSSKDFMHYLAISVFSRKIYFKSKADFLVAFEAYLRRCLQEQKNFNLIIDEAHKLSFDLLEEIRLLSNMETGENKLINIFLVGQPELNATLSEPRCRPLLQRISIRYHIRPLSLVDTRDYMDTRLKVAGVRNIHHIFRKSAINTIHEYSKGYPRMINILADNALLLGYSRETKKITGAMVNECREDLRLAAAYPINEASEPDLPEIKKIEPAQIRRHRKRTAILFFLFLALFAAGAMSLYGKETLERSASFIQSMYHSVVQEFSGQTLSTENEIRQKIANSTNGTPKELEKPPGLTAQIIGTEAEGEEEVTSDVTITNKVVEDLNLVRELSEEGQNPSTAEYDQHEEARVIVKEGDTITALALAVYGRSDENIIELIHKYNPKIKDINWIEVGQEIVFPHLMESDIGSTFTVHVASYKPFDLAYAMFEDLTRRGHEVFLVPAHNPEKGKIFRVTMGSFSSIREAELYATAVLEQRISDYAKIIKLEMK